MTDLTSIFDQFAAKLRAPADALSALQAGVIGSGQSIGGRPLIYADYVASGRALKQVETFVMDQVLPYYANSHTEASFCGARMTGLREAARKIVAGFCHARPADHAVIFSGSGATSGLNQLVHLLDAGPGTTVLVGPYEHHSNLLPWRESGAQVVQLPEGAAPGPDMAALEASLTKHCARGPVVVAMSAASNVTGVCPDVTAVTRMVKRHGARMAWDYAGGAPYLQMSMTPARGAEIDAIVFSGHKFLGGPAASGVLILRRDAVRSSVPYRPGGGTVAFVNAYQHDYVAALEAREEGGTPNIIGDIRVALAMIVKDVIGQGYLDAEHAALTARAFAAWGHAPQIHLLAPARQIRLPILSFVPHDTQGNRIDHDAFTRALSDRYGIQARGGCSCAGPYVHELLGLDDAQSATIRQDILKGNGHSKPGFVRLNLSVSMTDETVDIILRSVVELAQGWTAARAA